MNDKFNFVSDLAPLKSTCSREVLRYIFVGLVSSGTYLLISIGLVFSLSLPKYVAIWFGLSAGAVVSYLGHTWYTFKLFINRTVLIKYLGILILTYWINAGLISITATITPNQYQQILASGIITIGISYILNSHIVFTKNTNSNR